MLIFCPLGHKYPKKLVAELLKLKQAEYEAFQIELKMLEDNLAQSKASAKALGRTSHSLGIQ